MRRSLCRCRIWLRQLHDGNKIWRLIHLDVWQRVLIDGELPKPSVRDSRRERPCAFKMRKRYKSGA